MWVAADDAFPDDGEAVDVWLVTTELGVVHGDRWCDVCRRGGRWITQRGNELPIAGVGTITHWRRHPDPPNTQHWTEAAVADIAMCFSTRCLVAATCYRHPASGTRVSNRQTTAKFDSSPEFKPQDGCPHIWLITTTNRETTSD